MHFSVPGRMEVENRACFTPSKHASGRTRSGSGGGGQKRSKNRHLTPAPPLPLIFRISYQVFKRYYLARIHGELLEADIRQAWDDLHHGTGKEESPADGTISPRIVQRTNTRSTNLELR